MDGDFDDPAVDKSPVRSAVDALADTLTSNGKRRGRPRKNPVIKESTDSSSTQRSMSRASFDGEGDTMEERARKRRKRGSEDEEWDEEKEALTIAQRREVRTRKRPSLYSDEIANESKRRQQSMPRSGHGSRGRPMKSPYTGPTRAFAATYNKQVQPTLSRDEQEGLDKLKQHWHEIQNPMQAKLRILPLLRRGLFEKTLELITPVADRAYAGKGTIPDDIKSVFTRFPCSAGFLEFINSIRVEACLAFYDVCDRLFELSDLPDKLKIAQALRFWWNSFSFATRRRWELYARSLVYGLPKDPDEYKRPCAAGYEVPITLTKKRRAQEEQWEMVHARNISALEGVETMILCPLCEKDENAEQCKMGTIKEIQDHFFHYHWQVHGYACHFCGTMFPTADDLMSNHSECQEWVAWNAARILTGTKSGKLGMTCCRMMMCCSDCGWHTTLTRPERGKEMSEEGKMNYLRTFFSYHNNDGLLGMVIYFPARPTDEMQTIRFTVTSKTGGNPQSTCEHCEPAVAFRDPADANEHYSKEHRDKARVCDQCQAQTTTEYLLKQHKMSHVHENSFLADYLSNTARIVPPPSNLSWAPRCGWKDRTKTEKFAYGGLMGEIGVNRGLCLVDPMEDVREMKVRLAMKRRREDRPAQDEGYENVEIEAESEMARKVREKLLRKYADCDGVGLIDDLIWLKDEDAIRFRDWMDYWESAEGRKSGGPPKKIEIDMSPSVVRIPAVEVELQFKDLDTISGFILDDNVFYCIECDSILKGEQAAEHLKLMGDETMNKCALDEGEIDENPHTNENLFQMYSLAASPSDSALPCPHCPHKTCSITGVRIHAMAAHGKYVKYKKVENENVTKAVVLKLDIRSRLARAMDLRLGMLPSGMLPQRQAIMHDVKIFTDQTWSQIIFTKENTDPVMLSQMKQLNDRGWTLDPITQGAPRSSPAVAGFMPRGGYQAQARGYHRQPYQMQTPVQRLSYEQSLQQQQHRVATPQMVPGRMVSNMPVVRGLPRGGVMPVVAHQSRGVVQSRGTPVSMVRLSGGGVGSSGGARKLVEISYGDDGKEAFKCMVCSNSVIFEKELIKAHLTRCHLHMCGHCSSAFVYEQEARNHAKKCRAERDHRIFHPDPRLPHLKTRCPMCPVQLPMVEMTMHLMDFHLVQLEYHMPHGKMNWNIKMVEHALPLSGKEPEVERLRYKYYVPALELAKAHGYHMCQVCGLQLPDQGKLQVHIKLHPEFMYFCWVCPRTTSASMGQVGAIMRHLRTGHLNDQDWSTGFLQCPLCRVNMAHRPLQHLLYECEHNFTCQLCRDLPAFESAVELKEHREKCHYNVLRRFECSNCSSYFSTTQDFSKHNCDPDMMRTACACGMEFRTRKLYIVHFELNHGRLGGCTFCHVKFRPGDDLSKHLRMHAKTLRFTDARHLLICAYGDLNYEAKTLYTTVSNASFRLRGLQGVAAGGGSEASPVQLSDDDDIIIEVPSTAVRKERQRAAGAAAAAVHGLPRPPTAVVNGIPRTSSPLSHSSVEAQVFELLKEMVNSVVKHEDTRLTVERRKMEASKRSLEAPLVELQNDSDDDDIVMMEDPTALTAHVRVEAEDTTVGGQNLPGYEEEEGEKETDSTSQQPPQPVIRHFAAEEDEDLCVVAEVENPGCASATATLNNQREKKFGCPKCSSKFMTKVTLSAHLKNAHQFDAGQSTITEELGIPLTTFSWICKSCCLAFQTHQQKIAHCAQHGVRPYGCDHCSGCAYNGEVMNQHARRVQDKKVAYVCGECKMEFDHETCLQEHNSSVHKVALFYFCKRCEMGSTDGIEIYRHFMAGCPEEPRPRSKTHEEAIKCIGVCPARQLHFQPLNVDVYRQAFAQQPDRFAIPSICNHRSLIAATDRLVTCNECKCLENIQRHMAFMSSEACRIFEAQLRTARSPPPLASLRYAYEQKMRDFSCRNQRLPPQQQHVVRHAPGSSNVRLHRPASSTSPTVPMGGSYPVKRVPVPTSTYHMQGFDPQEAQRRHYDRLNAVAMARANGATRPPVLTPGTVGGHLHNGGPSILRGRLSPLTPNSMHNGSLLPSHRPPVVTHSHLSTMDSLQSVAAMAHANGHHLPSTSAASSAASSPLAPNCTQCNVRMRSKREVFLHSLHTTERGAFVCAHCPIAIPEEKAAIRHIINHMEHADRMLDMDMCCPFPQCRVELPTLIALKNHIPMHNPPLRHRIESCHLTFGSAALARAHDEIHKASTGQNNCCILCGTMDNWQMEMVDDRGKGLAISHLMKHAFKHRYYCKLCDMKEFEEENQMITHYIMLHTKEDGDSRSCEDCSVTLMTDNDHKNHCMAKHTVTELFVPPKLVVKVAQTMNDYLGVGLDEPLPGRR